MQTNLTPLHRPITPTTATSQVEHKSANGHQSEQAAPPAPTMAAPQVEQKSAKARQSEQGDVKEEGIGLLAMPDD